MVVERPDEVCNLQRASLQKGVVKSTRSYANYFLSSGVCWIDLVFLLLVFLLVFWV